MYILNLQLDCVDAVYAYSKALLPNTGYLTISGYCGGWPAWYIQHCHVQQCQVIIAETQVFWLDGGGCGLGNRSSF